MLNELSYGEVFSRFPDRYNVCNVCQRNQTNGFAEKYEILKNTTEKEIALEAMQYYQCEGFTELILIPTFDNGEERMTPKECAAFFRTYYYKQSDEFC